MYFFFFVFWTFRPSKTSTLVRYLSFFFFFRLLSRPFRDRILNGDVQQTGRLYDGFSLRL